MVTRVQSALESAMLQLEKAVAHLGLDDGLHQLLATPRRSLEVAVPLRRDDGTLEVLQGYRVQHNLLARAGQGRHPLPPRTPTSTRSARWPCG